VIASQESSPLPSNARPSPLATPAAAAVMAVIIVVVDQWTKNLATTYLVPRHVPHPILGDVLRFTLTYNPGAAFGMHLGEASRWVFTTLTLLILGFLIRLYRATPALDTPLRVAVACVMGGAIGNLVDRLRSVEGVVDFIDVGVGDVRFWTFNVADMAVSLGAICLVFLLWRRDAAAAQVRAAHAGSIPSGASTADSLADRGPREL
jgi:signal peptidase II